MRNSKKTFKFLIILFLFQCVFSLTCCAKTENSQKKTDTEVTEIKEEKEPKTGEEWFAKAKQYENEKKWCHALGAYYDALFLSLSDVASNSDLIEEIVNRFKPLALSILNGNPGLGTYNEFTLHDEWKKLLEDTEEYVSSIFPMEVKIGDLVRGDLDYTTKTASYSASIEWYPNCRYKFLIDNILSEGYKLAYKSDWTDLPKFLHNVYKGRYLMSFVIVDENLKLLTPPELLMGAPFHPYNVINFSGIDSKIMDLIDNNKAFVVPYNVAKVRPSTFEYIRADKIGYTTNCVKDYFMKRNDWVEFQMVKIPGKNFSMLKTEVTQFLYEKVMGENPSCECRIGEDVPVNCVSYADAIIFCNELSKLLGYIPVYSVNDETDPTKWDYIQREKMVFCGKYDENRRLLVKIINGKIEKNETANGFRLPTKEEWRYASKGGGNFAFGNTDDVDIVAWHAENSDGVQPVGEKMSNGYSLYDMFGNVAEWGDNPESKTGAFLFGGGTEDYIHNPSYLVARVDFEHITKYVGFRIVRTVTE